MRNLLNNCCVLRRRFLSSVIAQHAACWYLLILQELPAGRFAL